MNVQSMMDLLGSQQAMKAAKTGASKAKSSASSSDLFSSIIGQKKDTTQNVTDIASRPATKDASGLSKDAANASKDTTNDAAGAAQDAAADDLQNADIMDDSVQDTPAGNEAADDTAVTEDTETSEEPIIEEEEAGEPQKIILSMQQMPVEAPMIAPVIITQESNIPSDAAIVNDVNLAEVPVQATEQLPADALQAMDGQAQNAGQTADETFSDLVATLETAQDAETTQEAPKQTISPETPKVQTQTPTPEGHEKAATVEELLSKLGEDLQPTTDVEHTQQQTQTAEKEPAKTHMDAAEQFASQVVDEAKTMTKQPVQEETTLQPVSEEEAEIAPQAAEEADTDEAPDDNKGQTEHKNMTHTSTPAQAADDGRVNFRMSAAQPLEAEPFIQPETRQMIMNRVVDQVRTAVTPDKTEFYLQLKPDYLGGLSIALASEDKGIVAKIMTSSQQVHNALQADMTALQQVLRDKGINVVQMEVIYDQMANSTMKDNSDNRGQQFSQGNTNSRSHGRISDDYDEALTMYDTLSSYEVLAENGGSVEFSA